MTSSLKLEKKEDVDKIPNFLRQRRIEKSISQNEAELLTGITQTNISKFELEKRKKKGQASIYLTTLLAYTEAYGLEIVIKPKEEKKP